MAWVLFASMLLYFISGYGMTKGIIDQNFAAKLHLSYLTYIILVAFVFHSAYAIRLALIRWKMWNGIGKLLWAMFYIFFVVGFVYVDKVFEKSSPVQSPTSIGNNSAATTSLVKTFTIVELSKYNGQNGNPAYVAVDGGVYDLTGVFRNGSHFSHFAGTELTNAFYSQHAKSYLSKYPVVGMLTR